MQLFLIQRFHDHLVIIVGNLTPIWIHLRAIRQCCFFRRRYNIPNTLLCLFIDREIIGIRIFYLIFLSGQIVQKVCTFLFLFASMYNPINTHWNDLIYILPAAFLFKSGVVHCLFSHQINPHIIIWLTDLCHTTDWLI